MRLSLYLSHFLRHQFRWDNGVLLMASSTTPRLPWQPHPEGGFIAYPEGWQAQPQRYGRLTPYLAGRPGQYSWSVNYDGQSIANLAETKQLASDAANGAWPKVIEMAKGAGAKSEWERNMLEMIEKAKRGEIEPGYLVTAEADYRDLMWIMTQVAPKAGYGTHVPEGRQRLIDALSRAGKGYGESSFQPRVLRDFMAG